MGLDVPCPNLNIFAWSGPKRLLLARQSLKLEIVRVDAVFGAGSGDREHNVRTPGLSCAWPGEI